MKCEIFKKYTFKFWPKNAGKLRFLLEFWVIFLSYRFLEFLCPWVFLRGAQKKACCKSKPHVLVSWPIKRARRLKNLLFKVIFLSSDGIRGVFDVEDLVDVLRVEKCADIVALSIDPKLGYVDHMVIATCRSKRHLRSRLARCFNWCFLEEFSTW